ncbi:MAG: GTP-binding protein, partial [Paludibacteraceae bacterium]|nr:GTP-binding protein [Paludibacteraceae bacterium]
QQMLASDTTLRHDWDEVYGDRMEKLVFIGQHLNKEEIKTLLDGCLE